MERRYMVVSLKAGQSLTAAQWGKLEDGFGLCAVNWNGVQPCDRLQLNRSLDGREMLVELAHGDLSKSEIFDRLVTALGLAVGTVNSKVVFTVFDEAGTVEGSATGARAYVAASAKGVWGP